MAIVTKTEIKKLAAKANMRISGEFWGAIDETIEWKIKNAVKRAKGNGRKTLKAYDL